MRRILEEEKRDGFPALNNEKPVRTPSHSDTPLSASDHRLLTVLEAEVARNTSATEFIGAMLETKIADINAAIAELHAKDDARVKATLKEATQLLERGATASANAAELLAETATKLGRAMETAAKLSRTIDSVSLSLSERMDRLETTVGAIAPALTGTLTQLENTVDKTTGVLSRRLDNLDDKQDILSRLSQRLDQIERTLETKVKELSADVARIGERNSKDDSRIKAVIEEAPVLLKQGATIYTDSAKLIADTATNLDRNMAATAATLSHRMERIEKATETHFQNLSNELTKIADTNTSIGKILLSLYETQAAQMEATPTTTLASLKNECYIIRETILNAEAKSLTASLSVKESLLQRIFTLETKVDIRLAALERKMSGNR